MSGISPDAGEAFARELVSVYADTETEMMSALSRRLEKGIDGPNYYEQKLAQIGPLRKELEDKLAGKKAAVDKAVADGIRRSFDAGTKAATNEMVRYGLSSAFSATSSRAVEAIVAETIGQLGSTQFAILRQTEDVYREAVSRSAALATSGGLTRREASDRVLQQFAKRGITGFVDKAGRNWSLEAYSEMTMRTASGRAHVEGALGRFRDLGKDGDLVIVSDSPEECPLCRPFEGKVFSQSGADKEHDSLASAISAGLFHPNCTHSLGLYVEGLTEPMSKTENPDGYVERQEQRRLERKVREWKRREAAAIGPDIKRTAKAYRKEWEGKLGKFVEENNRKRLRYREKIFRPATGSSGPTVASLPKVPSSLGPRGSVLKVPDNVTRVAQARKEAVFLESQSTLSAALKSLDEKLYDLSPAVRDRFSGVMDRLSKFTIRYSNEAGRKKPIEVLGTTSAMQNRITGAIDVATLKMDIEFGRSKFASAYRSWYAEYGRQYRTPGVDTRTWMAANPPPSLTVLRSATVSEVEHTVLHEMGHAADLLQSVKLEKLIQSDGTFNKLRNTFASGTGDETFWYAVDGPAEGVAELLRMYVLGTKTDRFPNGMTADEWRKAYPGFAEWVENNIFGGI